MNWVISLRKSAFWERDSVICQARVEHRTARERVRPHSSVQGCRTQPKQTNSNSQDPTHSENQLEDEFTNLHQFDPGRHKSAMIAVSLLPCCCLLLLPYSRIDIRTKLQRIKVLAHSCTAVLLYFHTSTAVGQKPWAKTLGDARRTACPQNFLQELKKILWGQFDSRDGQEKRIR